MVDFVLFGPLTLADITCAERDSRRNGVRFSGDRLIRHHTLVA
jgi:hypothetical protein